MSDGFIGDIETCPDLIGQVLGVRGFERAGHFLASPFQGDPWQRPTYAAVCQPNGRATAAALTATGAKPKTAVSAAQRIIERQLTRPDHDAPARRLQLRTVRLPQRRAPDRAPALPSHGRRRARLGRARRAPARIPRPAHADRRARTP